MVALLQCKECGRDVSGKAYSCAQCGAPVPTNLLGKIVLATLLALLVGLVAFVVVLQRRG